MPRMRVEVPCVLMVTLDVPDEASALVEAQRITFDQFQSGLDLKGIKTYLGAPADLNEVRATLYFEPLDENTEINEE